MSTTNINNLPISKLFINNLNCKRAYLNNLLVFERVDAVLPTIDRTFTIIPVQKSSDEVGWLDGNYGSASGDLEYKYLNNFGDQYNPTEHTSDWSIFHAINDQNSYNDPENFVRLSGYYKAPLFDAGVNVYTIIATVTAGGQSQQIYLMYAAVSPSYWGYISRDQDSVNAIKKILDDNVGKPVVIELQYAITSKQVGTSFSETLYLAISKIKSQAGGKTYYTYQAEYSSSFHSRGCVYLPKVPLVGGLGVVTVKLSKVDYYQPGLSLDITIASSDKNGRPINGWSSIDIKFSDHLGNEIVFTDIAGNSAFFDRNWVYKVSDHNALVPLANMFKANDNRVVKVEFMEHSSGNNGAADPLFDDVVALIGVNDQGQIADLSNDALSITKGNAVVPTNGIDSQFNSKSIKFGSDGDGIDWHLGFVSDKLNFGTDVDYTIELWVNFTLGTLGAYPNQPIMLTNNASVDLLTLRLNNNRVEYSEPVQGQFGDLSDPDQITKNVWNHIAVCRKGTKTMLFVNGKKIAETTSPMYANFYNNGEGCFMSDVNGSESPNYHDNSITGKVNKLRITRNHCRYETDFTPAPFPTRKG